jgi:hypothetical protein
MFKDMANSGVLDLGNILHMECLWFCFHGVLHEDLDKIRLHWNTHRIRSSRYGTVPGIPDVLYHLPERSGGQECKVTISREKIQEVSLHYDDYDGEETHDGDYKEYFHYVMENEGFLYPDTPTQAHELFSNLTRIANT